MLQQENNLPCNSAKSQGRYVIRNLSKLLKMKANAERVTTTRK